VFGQPVGQLLGRLAYAEALGASPKSGRPGIAGSATPSGLASPNEPARSAGFCFRSAVPERIGTVLLTAFAWSGSQNRTSTSVVRFAPVSRGRKVSRLSLNVTFGPPKPAMLAAMSSRLPADGMPGGRLKKNFPSTTPVSKPTSRARCLMKSQSVCATCARWVCAVEVASMSPIFTFASCATFLTASESVVSTNVRVRRARCNRWACSYPRTTV
jgi:hypothetical protein